MAKNKKTRGRVKPEPRRQPLQISQTVQDGIVSGLFVIILLILLKPIAIDGLAPQGVDTISSRAKTHQIVEFKEDTGETALWNPAIFSGMPIYQSLNPESFSIDTILNLLGRLASGVFIYYLF